jgi:hypothetical protein
VASTIVSRAPAVSDAMKSMTGPGYAA